MKSIFGCCRARRSKFINKDGALDPLRIESVISRVEVKNCPVHLRDKMKDQIQNCRCECHQDGLGCLC